MVKEFKYLGYKLSTKGVKVDEEKIRPILEAKRPKDVKELKSFLGAVTFYARFIKNLSKISNPLYALLKKGSKWRWTEQCEESFLKLN